MDNQINYARCPWRRYLARELDISLYGLLWNAILVLIFHMEPTLIENEFGEQILTGLVSVGLMLLLEPLWLHLFATTPGKAILGLRITQEDGSHLTLQQGLERTWQVAKTGMGFMIPIYSLYCLYKGYKQCTEERKMSWDLEMAYTVNTSGWYRWPAYVVAYMAVLGGTVLIVLFFAQNPPNHGNMTVADFAENYNYMADYLELDNTRKLAPDGTWAEPSDSVYYIDINELPVYSYTVEDGVLTGVSFQVEEYDQRGWMPAYSNQMVLSALAFTSDENGFNLLSNDRQNMINQIEKNADFDFTIGDVRLTCKQAMEGYELIESIGGFVADENAGRTHYKLIFEMQKVK